MAAYNWNAQKERHLQELENAGISPKSDFGKQYLKFARRINTCWNKLAKGRSWESVTSCQASDEAREILESFNGEGHRYETPKYWNEWVRLCEANGINIDSNTGDWMC